MSQLKLIFIVTMGSILETYDFSLYGYYAQTLAQLFFPQSNKAFALLLTFTVFAVGFITRPLGAAIFGSIGDKYGRKSSLLISIMLMAIPTAAIGILPTYAQIGLGAPILLMICRLLQGVAVGAEFTGTMVYMVESAPGKLRAFYGSLCICSGYIAMLLTAFMVNIFSTWDSSSQMAIQVWRIPFLFSVFLGVVGLCIRSRLPETAAFKTIQEGKAVAPNPLLKTLTCMPARLLLSIGVIIVHSIGFYLLFVYLNSYLQNYYHLSLSRISLMNMVAITIAIIAVPIIGLIAERTDKRNLIIIGTMGLILFSLPLFKLIETAHIAAFITMQASLTLLLCLVSAVLPAFLTELFPVELRSTGMALAYNLSGVIFGGTTPLTLYFFLKKTEQLNFPAWYLMLSAGVSLVSVLAISYADKRAYALKLDAS